MYACGGAPALLGARILQVLLDVLLHLNTHIVHFLVATPAAVGLLRDVPVLVLVLLERLIVLEPVESHVLLRAAEQPRQGTARPAQPFTEELVRDAERHQRRWRHGRAPPREDKDGLDELVIERLIRVRDRVRIRPGSGVSSGSGSGSGPW